ncbi:hypothetical protein [Herbidospora sp. NBRC 101105]|uniref:hypothetical protein n=1 Tax=Herbidospora sp. NBRC 101105 TaxID=3032195 RepID=UPI0024A25FDB|nr:hypothetical protein [Herbidospora sp. NBRC 101105]GLX98636.1 hypothetical protein Hesp01_65860 [Herbidospora sp. NBRC 101105]
MPRRMSADELLETSPFRGDLSEELTARPTRAKLPRLTLFLAAGVVLVAGILVGIQAQKTFGAVDDRTAMIGQLMAGRGGQAGAQPARQGTVGTVKLVDGAKVYVEGADGTTTVVTTGDDTEVRISKEGKLSDLKPGASVVVQGERDADGNVAATSVTEGGGVPRMRANQ